MTTRCQASRLLLMLATSPGGFGGTKEEKQRGGCGEGSVTTAENHTEGAVTYRWAHPPPPLRREWRASVQTLNKM